MSRWNYGFGDSDAGFTATLTADGLPPNVANRSYSETYQDDYKVFRSYGIDGALAWDMMETLDRDQGAMKALAAGVPPDLVVQAWIYQLFSTGSPTSTAIVAGQNPAQAIAAGLASIGITPVTTTNTGPSQLPVTPYTQNLPAGMLPGSPYTAAGVTYQPDWFMPAGAPPTATQIATAQAQVPATSNYWLFPSGDTEDATGAVTGPAAAQQPAAVGTPLISAPVGGGLTVDGLTITPTELMVGGGLIIAALLAFDIMGHHKSGRSR